MEVAGLSFEARRSDLSRRLESALVPPAALLGNLGLIDESSRHTGQYQDPRYLPFYYHLGRVFAPRRLLFVGLDIGLHLACMLKGCPAPESAFCVQGTSESFYSPRLAISNAKSAGGRELKVGVHIGDLRDPDLLVAASGPFDAAAITSEMSGDSLIEAMDFCWGRISERGFLCVDRLSKKGFRELFEDFCQGRGAERAFFDTRYGCGIAVK